MRKLSFNSNKSKLSIFLLVFFISLSLSVAYSFKVDASNHNYGFFSDRNQTAECNRRYPCHNVLRGGLPFGGVWENLGNNNKEPFIKYIESLVYSGDDHSMVGSRYIIESMIGIKFTHGTYNEFNKYHIDEWKKRLLNSSISVYTTSRFYGRGSTNTLIDSGFSNIFKYSEGKEFSADVAVFYNNIPGEEYGKEYFVIKRDCANPLGDLDGLPEATKYSLTPYISTQTADIVESGSSINLNLKVNNDGNATSDDTDWWVTRTIDGNIDDDGKVKRTFGVGDNEWNKIDTPSEAPAGAQVCYVLSLDPRSKPRSNDGKNGISSNRICITIGKKPKFQIWGGSLWVGGSVQTSTSTKNVNGTNATFGSWDEYGIFSAGTLTGMASGSAFASANGLSGVNSACNYSKLSFANSNSNGNCDSSTEIGKYTNSKSIPDIASNFPTNASTPAASSDLSTLQGLYVVDPSNSLTINGGTIKKGQWVVINAPNATITIAGNIDYTNETLNSLNDIPQVIIIANKIVINSNVTNIDSWLIAKKSGLTDGEIYTCDVVGNTVKICDKQLKINGPVITDKLFLRRTAGSGSGVNSGDPAEIINLRADAYLWSANRASINGHIQTIYVTELPPRF